MLNVAPDTIDGVVIGEHGDSEVAVFSTVRVAGLPLKDFAASDTPDCAKLAEEVRTAGYRIIAGKGYTSFGVATAIVRICEAILRDERTALPVSTLLTGEFGLTDIYLSLPCILGSGGVVRVVPPDLSKSKIADLMMSAAAVRSAQNGLHGG
jgi:L-lactate dehydrogenase